MTETSESELKELLQEVRRIELQARRLVTSAIAGGYASVFRGAGVEFDEVREYVPGDDPRSVDWNVTARLGRPYVKKFVDERELTVLFLLDLSPSMDGGFGAWSMRQTAARLCACLALSAVANNDKVGLIAFSGEVDRYIEPERGFGHVLRIIRSCLELRGESGRTDFTPALEFAANTTQRRSVLFLVSDFLADGWEDGVVSCSRRHDLIAARLLAPELTPPAGGLLRLRDPESGREEVVDWGVAAARDAYRESVARWRRRTEIELHRARVDLMDVLVPRNADSDAVARPILSFFRMRELRGAGR